MYFFKFTDNNHIDRIADTSKDRIRNQNVLSILEKIFSIKKNGIQ